jgi:hypothetical protein
MFDILLHILTFDCHFDITFQRPHFELSNTRPMFSLKGYVLRDRSDLPPSAIIYIFSYLIYPCYYFIVWSVYVNTALSYWINLFTLWHQTCVCYMSVYLFIRFIYIYFFNCWLILMKLSGKGMCLESIPPLYFTGYPIIINNTRMTRTYKEWATSLQPNVRSWNFVW